MAQRLFALYARKSRLKEDNVDEIEKQVELLTRYASENNMDYEVFAEQGSSEAWDTRPQLQRMLAELDRNIYDGILVTDQDRITRDSTDWGLFVRIIEEKKIQFFTLDGKVDLENENTKFFSGMKAQMDSYTMMMTKRKLRRGRIQAIEKGVYFGIAPYGFSKDATKRLIPHETEANVVRSIFDMYVREGRNQAEIVNELNLRGYITREGKPFTVRSTSIILSNVAYRGIVHYEMENEKPIHVEDAHPAIIDEDTFNRAQVIKAEKRKVPQSSRIGEYSLSRLIKCPKCGQTLSFCLKYTKRSARKTLNKDERELYVLNCYASKSAKGKRETEERCSNNGIRSSRIEEEVFKRLRSRLDEIDTEIDSILSGDDTFLNNIDAKEKELNSTLDKLEEQKRKVQQGYKVGIYDEDETLAEIKRIRERQLIVKQELENLEGTNVKSEVDRKRRIKEKIETLLSADKLEPSKTNKLLREVIDTVWYWKEKSDVGGEKPFEIKIEYK